MRTFALLRPMNALGHSKGLQFSPPRFITLVLPLFGAVNLLMFAAGCTGIPTDQERIAQKGLAEVERGYRPDSARPQLPALAPETTLADFIRYALLNHPKVEATYYDWAASVRRITVERSLPDPRLTFEADIADMVMTLMPGLMVDLPGPGKLRAAAAVASAESDKQYVAFKTAVLEAAFNLKRAYYELFFLEERIGVSRNMLTLLGEVEKVAQAQSEVAKATLQDVLRAQIEQERVQTEIVNLEDSRHPLKARFKAALGLSEKDPEPPYRSVSNPPSSTFHPRSSCQRPSNTIHDCAPWKRKSARRTRPSASLNVDASRTLPSVLR